MAYDCNDIFEHKKDVFTIELNLIVQSTVPAARINTTERAGVYKNLQRLRAA